MSEIFTSYQRLRHQLPLDKHTYSYSTFVKYHKKYQHNLHRISITCHKNMYVYIATNIPIGHLLETIIEINGFLNYLISHTVASDKRRSQI